MVELEKTKLKDQQEAEQEEQWAKLAAQEALAGKAKPSK